MTSQRGVLQEEKFDERREHDYEARAYSGRCYSSALPITTHTHTVVYSSYLRWLCLSSFFSIVSSTIGGIHSFIPPYSIPDIGYSVVTTDYPNGWITVTDTSTSGG